ncbi:hypothetical protein JBL43_19870 [Aureibaculum sp. A20]|uniref:Uncharacterized protein n=1 Tax=Aureibaculum flavum TaxID=2795986 RepID=A0ABS0WX09_9FLAO|nr:hypothetical protein [Aureibaculum flavum]MBJ2176516.1 hypothetical protein [Aureibaculum flavum]
MKPQFPIISIYNKGLDIIPSDTDLTKATVLAVLNGSANTHAFDGNGQKWTYEFTSDKVNDKFLTRFLANTFYNPIVDIKTNWTLMDKYTLEELKKEISECIDDDDDILTQFIESDDLKKEIFESKSFESIIQQLKKHVFQELWNNETQ